MSDSLMIKLPIASCIIYVSVLLLSVFVSSSFSIIVLHLPLSMNDAKDESQRRLKTQLKHLEEELQNAKEESLSLLLTTSKEKELLEKKLTSMKQSVLQVEANNNNDDLGPAYQRLVEERDHLHEQVDDLKSIIEGMQCKIDEMEMRDGSQRQVDLLNSIIVEMQHKNDFLKAHVELLETRCK